MTETEVERSVRPPVDGRTETQHALPDSEVSSSAAWLLLIPAGNRLTASKVKNSIQDVGYLRSYRKAFEAPLRQIAENSGVDVFGCCGQDPRKATDKTFASHATQDAEGIWRHVQSSASSTRQALPPTARCQGCSFGLLACLDHHQGHDCRSSVEKNRLAAWVAAWAEWRPWRMMVNPRPPPDVRKGLAIGGPFHVLGAGLKRAFPER